MKLRHALSMLALMMPQTLFAARYYTGLVVPLDADYGVPFLSWDRDISSELPDNLDLREAGHITAVKNQGSCGSCWAFAGVAAMESALLKANAQDLDLSEQELVSCDGESNGCGGGWQPFGYMVKKGIGAEAYFPYAGRNLSCKRIPPVAKALRWANVGAPDRRATVDEARKALTDFGGLWVSVGANSYWRNVAGGTINRCSNSQVNHAVTLAGFQKNDDNPSRAPSFQFLVKNSWGKDWSEDGYVKTPLGCNNLGRHTSFVVPEGHECTPPEFGLAKKVVLTGGKYVVHAKGLEAAGMPYSWYKVGSRVFGSGPVVAAPRQIADYVVKTKNSCGVWTQMVKVVTL
ncbi:MAG: hypothetical protein RIQ81_973 [Pseudomonadota bacterium]